MIQNPHIHKVLYVVGTLLAAATVYGAYILAVYVPPVPEAAPTSSNRGQLILTLKPLVPGSSHAGIYSYSLGTNALTVVKNDRDYFAPAFSTDNHTAVVAGNTDTEYRLYLATDKDEASAVPLVPPSPALSAGAAQWSKDNKFLAYTALTALKSVTDSDIENSRIVYVDTDTKEQVILDTGTSPLIQNNGSILYLKEDGVYRMTTNSMSPSAPERILYFDGYSATTQSRIALSPDEKYLAVTNPDTHRFDVYSVDIGDTNDHIVRSYIFSKNDIGFWPVFSPDSKSLAYIRYTTDNSEGTPPKKSVSVYDVLTGTSREVFDLRQFTNDFLSLSAWAK